MTWVVILRRCRRFRERGKMRSCFLPFWPLIYYAHLQRKVKPRSEVDERDVKESDPMVAFSQELSEAEDDAEHMIVRSVQRWMPCLLTVLTATVSTPGSSSTSFYMALLVWLLRVTKSKTGIAVHIFYPFIQFEFKWSTPEEPTKKEAKPKACERSTKKQSKDECTLMDMSVNNPPKEESSPLELTVEETKQLLPRFPAHYHQTYVEVIEKKEDELLAVQQEDPEKGFPHVVEKMKDGWEFNLVCMPLMILASFSARRSWLLSIIPVPIYFYRLYGSAPLTRSFDDHRPFSSINAIQQGQRAQALRLALHRLPLVRLQGLLPQPARLLRLLDPPDPHMVQPRVRHRQQGGQERKEKTLVGIQLLLLHDLPLFHVQSKQELCPRCPSGYVAHSVHRAKNGSLNTYPTVLIHFFWSWKKDGSTSSFALLFLPLLHFIYTSQTVRLRADSRALHLTPSAVDLLHGSIHLVAAHSA